MLLDFFSLFFLLLGVWAADQKPLGIGLAPEKQKPSTAWFPVSPTLTSTYPGHTEVSGPGWTCKQHGMEALFTKHLWHAAGIIALMSSLNLLIRHLDRWSEAYFKFEYKYKHKAKAEDDDDDDKDEGDKGEVESSAQGKAK